MYPLYPTVSSSSVPLVYQPSAPPRESESERYFTKPPLQPQSVYNPPSDGHVIINLDNGERQTLPMPQFQQQQQFRQQPLPYPGTPGYKPPVTNPPRRVVPLNNSGSSHVQRPGRPIEPAYVPLPVVNVSSSGKINRTIVKIQSNSSSPSPTRREYSRPQSTFVKLTELFFFTTATWASSQAGIWSAIAAKSTALTTMYTWQFDKCAALAPALSTIGLLALSTLSLCIMMKTAKKAITSSFRLFDSSLLEPIFLTEKRSFNILRTIQSAFVAGICGFLTYKTFQFVTVGIPRFISNTHFEFTAFPQLSTRALAVPLIALGLGSASIICYLAKKTMRHSGELLKDHIRIFGYSR